MDISYIFSWRNTMKNFWYDGSELITKGRLINFLIGLRGGGKTFYWKKKCLNDFINKGEQFIWLRRYQTELNEMGKWGEALQRKGYFEGSTIEASKKHVKIDGKVAGYVGTLSKAQHLKSTEFPLVTKIILDEFLITQGSLRYLPDEAEILLDLIETIFRDRDKGCIVVCIGNAISTVNPYFMFFEVKPDISKRYTLTPDIAVELYTNEDYSNMKKESRLGRIAMKTKWGSYAYENKFLNDDYSFIIPRTGKLNYVCGLKYEGRCYGVWSTEREGKPIYYVDSVIEKEGLMLAVDYDDLDEKARFVKTGWLKPQVDFIKIMFNNGDIYYGSLEAKKDFYYIIKVL